MNLGLTLLTPLEMLQNLPNFIRNMTSDNWLDATKATRIEPVTVVDAELWNHPDILDFLNVGLETVSSLYLKAVSLNSVIDGITINERLEQFSTTRDAKTNLAGTLANTVSLESQEDKPVLIQKPKFVPIKKLALEAVREGETPVSASGMTRDTLKQLKESSNLAVGKDVTVKIEIDGRSVEVPVTVRLQTLPLPSHTISNVLTAPVKQISYNDRLDRLKAKDITFWADFIFCRDLLDQHRKAIVTDKSGIVGDTYKKMQKNAISTFITGRPSVGQCTHLYYITEKTAIDIERNLSINLEKFSHRQKIFDATALMVLWVVDREWEQVTIYWRNIDKPTVVPFSGIRQKSNGKGENIESIVNALKINQAPKIF